MYYAVDMSQMAQFIKMAQSQEDENSMMGELSFKKFEPVLKEIKGISKVKSTDDLDNYIFSFSFAFADLNALNAALSVIMVPESDGSAQVAFHLQDGKLTCAHGGGNLAQLLLSRLGAEEDGDQAMALMQSMKYNITMNFKKPVEAVMTASDVTYDKTGKVIYLSSDFSRLIDSPKALSSSVMMK